mgnify:CR=1 FL=1
MVDLEELRLNEVKVEKIEECLKDNTLLFLLIGCVIAIKENK